MKIDKYIAKKSRDLNSYVQCVVIKILQGNTVTQTTLGGLTIHIIVLL